MKCKAPPAQAEQVQQRQTAQPDSIWPAKAESISVDNRSGALAQRKRQEITAKSPQVLQLMLRSYNLENTPSVLPPEMPGGSLSNSPSEPPQKALFGSISNNPRLIAQHQQMMPFFANAVVQRAKEEEPLEPREMLFGHRIENFAQRSVQEVSPAPSSLIQRTVWQWNATEKEWKKIDTTQATTAEKAPTTEGESDGQVYDGVLDRLFKSMEERRQFKLDLDPYFSDYSGSDDDDAKELTNEQQMDLLIKKGQLKKKKLVSRRLDKTKKRFELHHPYSRKIYSAHRATKGSKVVNLGQQELVLIGQQQIRMGEGTGHYVQPGGNLNRPKTIKEPEASYSKFFSNLMTLGKDPAASPLYKAATGRDLPSKDTLSDAEAAALAFYYFNNDADAIEKKINKRTALTEHLSKFSAIAGIAEQSRAFEAIDSRTKTKPEAPYDASLFIKQGLLAVMKGDYTLRDMFYAGLNGTESIFLGGPTQDKNKKITGGSEQLRNPFGYREALKRQLKIFPKNKKKFKEQLNALRTNALSTETKVVVPELSKEKAEELAKQRSAEYLQRAKDLTAEIDKLVLPTSSAEIQDFCLEKRGPIQKFHRAIKKLKNEFGSDSEAIEELKRAKVKLVEKAREANKVIGL